MRAIFTIGGLVVVLAIVGVLAKKQLASGVAPQAGEAMGGTVAAPQQQVQQFQKAAETALQQAQQARPMPDDAR